MSTTETVDKASVLGFCFVCLPKKQGSNSLGNRLGTLQDMAQIISERLTLEVQ